jgi:RNA polymerase sigma factor for flagellar operon FliA
MLSRNLWVKYKEKGSQEAKNELVIDYVELVKIIAGRLFTKYNGKVLYDDLVGYGIVGLIDAVEKFDYKRNVKFRTYANIRIRGAIIDQLRAIDWVPRSIRSKYKQHEKILEELQNHYGEEITDEMISEKLNLSLSKYYEFLEEISIYSIYSLDKKFSESVNFDIKSDYIEFQPESSIEKKELIKELTIAVDTLSEREKKIVQLYYYSELTYKEMSIILGITESRISQLHSQIIVKLKSKLDDE